MLRPPSHGGHVHDHETQHDLTAASPRPPLRPNLLPLKPQWSPPSPGIHLPHSLRRHFGNRQTDSPGTSVTADTFWVTCSQDPIIIVVKSSLNRCVNSFHYEPFRKTPFREVVTIPEFDIAEKYMWCFLERPDIGAIKTKFMASICDQHQDPQPPTPAPPLYIHTPLKCGASGRLGLPPPEPFFTVNPDQPKGAASESANYGRHFKPHTQIRFLNSSTLSPFHRREGGLVH